MTVIAILGASLSFGMLAGWALWQKMYGPERLTIYWLLEDIGNGLTKFFKGLVKFVEALMDLVGKFLAFGILLYLLSALTTHQLATFAAGLALVICLGTFEVEK